MLLVGVSGWTPQAGRHIESPDRLLVPPARAMPLFWKPYKSDVTRFIEELKAKKPTLEDEQRAGRALLWDRAIDSDAHEAYREANVPQQPYVYQTDS
jgi:Protein of unknown function (DUF3460)